MLKTCHLRVRGKVPSARGALACQAFGEAGNPDALNAGHCAKAAAAQNLGHRALNTLPRLLGCNLHALLSRTRTVLGGMGGGRGPTKTAFIHAASTTAFRKLETHLWPGSRQRTWQPRNGGRQSCSACFDGNQYHISP